MSNMSQRWPDQPAWLQLVVEGLSDSRRYSVILEGTVYAIIKCPGSSLYHAYGGYSTYHPVRFLLVKKGVNYWHGTWKEAWKGRLTNEGKVAIAKALASQEAAHDPPA